MILMYLHTNCTTPNDKKHYTLYKTPVNTLTLLTNWSCIYWARIHEARDEGLDAVDVDGLCLYKKMQQLNNSGVYIELPDLPLSASVSGWEP